MGLCRIRILKQVGKIFTSIMNSFQREFQIGFDKLGDQYQLDTQLKDLKSSTSPTRPNCILSFTLIGHKGVDISQLSFFYLFFITPLL